MALALWVGGLLVVRQDTSAPGMARVLAVGPWAGAAQLGRGAVTPPTGQAEERGGGLASGIA